MTAAENLLKHRVLAMTAAVELLNEKFSIEGASSVPLGNELLFDGVEKIAEIFGTSVENNKNYQNEPFISTKIEGVWFIEYKEDKKNVSV